jgi:hypothetical protein
MEYCIITMTTSVQYIIYIYNINIIYIYIDIIYIHTHYIYNVYVYIEKYLINYPHDIFFHLWLMKETHRFHPGLQSLWSRHREILELLRSRPISPAENAPMWSKVLLVTRGSRNE